MSKPGKLKQIVSRPLLTVKEIEDNFFHDSKVTEIILNEQEDFELIPVLKKLQQAERFVGQSLTPAEAIDRYKQILRWFENRGAFNSGSGRHPLDSFAYYHNTPEIYDWLKGIVAGKIESRIKTLTQLRDGFAKSQQEQKSNAIKGGKSKGDKGYQKFLQWLKANPKFPIHQRLKQTALASEMKNHGLIISPKTADKYQKMYLSEHSA